MRAKCFCRMGAGYDNVIWQPLKNRDLPINHASLRKRSVRLLRSQPGVLNLALWRLEIDV
jgi:hypothetical protein